MASSVVLLKHYTVNELQRTNYYNQFRYTTCTSSYC